ncbi:MAG: serine hydrolase domain-containing protein [Planctomycetaceae bacterium]|nr:serine hydrolase domain-containing protein [Planctomycetaceae bacterium]
MTALSPADFTIEFPDATAVYEQGRERGLHTGAQVFVSHHGRVLADVGLGDARPGVPMTAEHLTLWLSAGKPLTAALTVRLWERGLIDLDAPVAAVIPEFAANGKGRITPRHILTHTAGLRTVETGWPTASWNETIGRICAASLDADAVPGETAGYHTASSWFVLGEIAQRLCGRPFVDVIRDEIFQPCGMTDTRSSISATELPTLSERIAPLWERSRTGLALLGWHEPPRVTSPSPGSNTWGPIRELGRFYETLRTGGLLQPKSLSAMTARQRVGQFDATLGHVVDFGLGVIIDSNQYGADTVPYGYGRFCSPRTFGHGGAQSSQGYCDPDRGLVVAYLFNGRAGEPQHNRRCRTFNEALYRDLNIAQQEAQG